MEPENISLGYAIVVFVAVVCALLVGAIVVEWAVKTWKNRRK